MSDTQGKAVEIVWSVVPFRSDEFVALWRPYAELAINFGAKGYLLLRQADDELIVKQYAFFENKADWERYWNSDALQKGRTKILGLHAVPLLYTWQEILTHGQVEDAGSQPAVAANADI